MEKQIVPKPGNLVVLAVLALAAALAGCMQTPYDGQVVATRSSAMTFDGFYTAPNTTISVYAYGSMGVGRTLITTAVSDSAVDAYLDSYSLYYWSAGPHTVPSAYWFAGATGYYTFIGAESSAAGLISTVANNEACFSQSGGANQTVDHYMAACQGEHHSLAMIKTQNYTPPGSCGYFGGPCCPGSTPCSPATLDVFAVICENNICNQGAQNPPLPQ